MDKIPIPASIFDCPAATAAVRRYPFAVNADLKAASNLTKPALSAGDDGYSQSMSSPSNPYVCKKATADWTKAAIFAGSATRIEYLLPCESLYPPKDIIVFKLEFFCFKATNFAYC